MKNNNNILIITASHPYRDSGVIAFDLMQALKRIGYNVEIITNNKLDEKYENTVSLKGFIRDIYIRIKNRIKRYTLNEIASDPNYYMHDLNETNSVAFGKRILKKTKLTPNAIIYLFSNHFLTPHDLHYLYLNTQVPIFWYMMDMSPMTGGCHYAWDCLGYTKVCGKCPGIYSDNKNDQTHINWQNKLNYIKNSNIIPIAASEWQYKQLINSSLFKNKKKYKIYLPINNTLFKPGDKFKAREILELPNDKKIIFFGAVSVNEFRKGYKELNQALKILKTLIPKKIIDNVELVIAGNCNDKMLAELPFNYTLLGYLAYSKLVTAFQAADMFVCPSIEDSGPMLVNQSIMCGTPVVSFEMGISIDLVHNELTGFRANLKDVNSLAIGIKKILELDKDQIKNMRDNCIHLSDKLLKTERITEKLLKMLTENLH